MVLISAYFSVLFSLPSISEFAEIGPYEVAQFDAYISGPLEKPDIERIRSAAETTVEGACSGGVPVYVKGEVRRQDKPHLGEQFAASAGNLRDK